MELAIVFHIEATDDGYSSEMDSPDQDAFGIETNETTFTDKVLVVKITDLNFLYTGTLPDKKNIEGSFT